ncbi:rCG21728, partial [Rattus norvegicus]
MGELVDHLALHSPVIRNCKTVYRRAANPPVR